MENTEKTMKNTEVTSNVKNKKKTVLLVAIFSVLATVILLSIFTSGDSYVYTDADYIILEREDGVYLADLSDEAAANKKLCEKNKTEYGNRYIFNDDQTKLLYFNCTGEDDDETIVGEWWLCDTETMKKTLVAENVDPYIDISSDFKAVLYLKGEDDILCYKAFDEDAIEIATECWNYLFTADMKTICYVTETGVFRYMPEGEDILISDSDEVCGFDEMTGELFLYNNIDNTLLKNNGEKNEVVMEYAQYYYGFYVSRESYYQIHSKTIDLGGSIIDDMYETDKKSPESAEKERRDKIRKLIDAGELNLSLHSLIYYDGEHKQVCDNLLYSLTDERYNSKGNEDITVSLVLSDYKIPRVKMSELAELHITEDYKICDFFYEKLLEQAEFLVTKQDRILGKAKISDIDMFLYDDETETLYFKCYGAGDDDLYYNSSYYSVCIKDGVVGKTETIAENVLSNYGAFYINGNKLIYDSGRSVRNQIFTLYAGDKVIAENVEQVAEVGDGVLHIMCKGEKKGEKENLFLVEGKIMKVKDINGYTDFYKTNGGHIISTEPCDGKLAVINKKGKLRFIENPEGTNLNIYAETYH